GLPPRSLAQAGRGVAPLDHRESDLRPLSRLPGGGAPDVATARRLRSVLAAAVILAALARGVPARAGDDFSAAGPQRRTGSGGEPMPDVPEYGWERVTARAAFAPRDGAGALTFKGRMWLLGGWNPGDKKHFPRICNNEVWSSADGKQWRLDKPNTFLDKTFDPARDWEGRHTAGYAVHKGRMWIVGGDVNQGHYHFDVWNSADGKAWTWVNKGEPVPWGPRVLHYTVVHD